MKKQGHVHGQSLVEFALCLPVLILILMGLFDLGRAYNVYVVITNAAREGAYYGSMHPLDTSGIVARAINEAQDSGITLTADDVVVSTSGISGTPICVTVRYDFQLLWSYLLGAGVIPLQSCAEMVIY